MDETASSLVKPEPGRAIVIAKCSNSSFAARPTSTARQHSFAPPTWEGAIVKRSVLILTMPPTNPLATKTKRSRNDAAITVTPHGSRLKQIRDGTMMARRQLTGCLFGNLQLTSGNLVGCCQAHAPALLVQALRKITRTAMQRVAAHVVTSAKYRHLDRSQVDV